MDTAKTMDSPYTIDDIYGLPDGQRAELIDVEDSFPPNTE